MRTKKIQIGTSATRRPTNRRDNLSISTSVRRYPFAPLGIDDDEYQEDPDWQDEEPSSEDEREFIIRQGNTYDQLALFARDGNSPNSDGLEPTDERGYLQQRPIQPVSPIILR